MAKKGYKRPKIERVKLVAEEAVLACCKGAPPSGPVTTGCFDAQGIAECFCHGS